MRLLLCFSQKLTRQRDGTSALIATRRLQKRESQRGLSESMRAIGRRESAQDITAITNISSRGIRGISHRDFSPLWMSRSYLAICTASEVIKLPSIPEARLSAIGGMSPIHPLLERTNPLILLSLKMQRRRLSAAAGIVINYLLLSMPARRMPEVRPTREEPT